MSIQLLHARHLGLLGRLGCNRTIFHVNRARGSGPHVGSTISSCAVLQEQSIFRTSSTTCTKNLGIRHDPQCSYLATTMLRQNQRNCRPISTHATEEGVGRPTYDEWIDRFAHKPEVHNVDVLCNGRNNGWESVDAVFMQQPANNDSNGRACQRRVWIGFSGSEPTKEELALGWPQDKQMVARRTLLLDWKEHKYYGGPFEFRVSEKRGENGRRFWRETKKQLTDEEECREWKQWMTKEANRDWKKAGFPYF